MQFRLIISGATRGIGKETAKLFASKGFQVAFCGTNAQTVAKTEEEFRKSGFIAFGFTADLTKSAEARKFAEDAVKALGGCDVLINNTGMYAPGSIENEAVGVFEKQMAVNLNSAYYLTKALIPEIRKGNRRHIFSMCSIASLKAYPNGSSYCISKFALLGMTRVLREELKPWEIAVTAVMPGAVYTESWGETDLPLTRFMRTTDVASAIYNAWSVNENTVIEDLVMRPVAGDI